MHIIILCYIFLSEFMGVARMVYAFCTYLAQYVSSWVYNYQSNEIAKIRVFSAVCKYIYSLTRIRNQVRGNCASTAREASTSLTQRFNSIAIDVKNLIIELVAPNLVLRIIYSFGRLNTRRCDIW